jgi:iron complex transport system ATP-binding protein
MISHDLNLAAEFCRRLLLLDHGGLAADGPPAAVLQEDVLRRVYHCDVRVQRRAGDGGLSVTPVPRLASQNSGQGIRVHVVAGGGSGVEVLRRLCLCGYTVTCGVLNQGDSDAQAAAALDVETVLVPPFSPVSGAALAQARELVGRADGVVVCGMPVGPANLANLALAAEALARAKPVWIMDGMPERDYTPGREAARRAGECLGRGALAWRTVPELFARLPANPPPA